jgi:RNA polymerase sigma-70 factor (ECF subfamily)
MMGGIDTDATADLERVVRDDYVRLVRAVALACGSVPAAEDAVQEAFARAWDRVQGGEQIDRLGGWIVTVALNITRSGRRQAWRLRVLSEDRPAPAAGRGAEDQIVLREAIGSLPRRQREVIVLHYYLDHDVRTIAQLLDRSEGAIKNALFHGRAALAKALGADSDDEEVGSR